MQKNLSSFDKFIRAKIYFKGNVEDKTTYKTSKTSVFISTIRI